MYDRLVLQCLQGKGCIGQNSTAKGRIMIWQQNICQKTRSIPCQIMIYPPPPLPLSSRILNQKRLQLTLKALRNTPTLPHNTPTLSVLVGGYRFVNCLKRVLGCLSTVLPSPLPSLLQRCGFCTCLVSLSALFFHTLQALQSIDGQTKIDRQKETYRQPERLTKGRGTDERMERQIPQIYIIYTTHK